MKWVPACKCFSRCLPQSKRSITVSSFWWINVPTPSPVGAPVSQRACGFLFASRTENSFPHHPSHVKAVAVLGCLEPELLVDKEDCLAGGPCLQERRERPVLAIWGPPCCHLSRLHEMLNLNVRSCTTSSSFVSVPPLTSCACLFSLLILKQFV